MITETLIGDTVKLTWISSGASLDANVPWKLYNGSETIVSTGTMTDSGNGHQFALVTLPDTAGLYVAETLASISGYPFKRRSKIKATLGEVD